MNLTTVSNENLFLTRFGWIHFWTTLCLLGILIFCTIVGNVFVVAAILLEKHLQGVSNYLIASLAVADLMVATLPMPLSAINEVSDHWWLGEALCDFWVCSDVLCCTASILHLVGIAMDRYWAVTNAEYIRRRTAKRICLMIGMFWLLSIAISIPARFNWTRLTESTSFDTRSNITRVDHSNKACLINQEYGYTIFSTVGAFYMPMLFMVGIYARIYQVARARIRRANFKKHTDHSIDSNGSTVTNSPTEKSVLCNNACRYCAVCCISFKRNKHTNGVVKNPVHHDLTSKPQDHSAQSPDKAISQTGETETLQVQTETLTSKSRQNHNSSELPHTVSSSKPTLHHLDRTPPKHQDKRTVCKLKADSYLESSPENNGQGMAYENPSRLHMHGNSSIEYTQYVSSSHHFCHFHRNLWNGTSNSAPPSLCAYSRVCNSWSTLFDSEGSCASNSERSDSIGWSSSYSINFRQPVQTRMNSEPGKSLPPAGLYARLKTLIVRKSYSGHNNPMSTKELKQTEILKDKVKRGISTNGGKVKKSSLPKRRLSHTYSDRHRTMTTREPAPTTDSSQTEEEAGNYLEGKSGARCPVHKPHLEEVIEQEEYSKGKSNLEARLKSTVPGVKKLATVTAMMKRERLEIKRERKAAVTLAIITGCFMLCWIPFFIVALIGPFYPQLDISRSGQAFVLWLGYSNSLLNPIIYTIFSPDFRSAFRKILFGRYYLGARGR